MKTVTLQVPDEVAAIVDGIVAEIADIKAAKGIAIELADAMPIVLAAGSSYTSLPADIKSPDAIAYMAHGLAMAFMPVAAPVVK